MITIVLYHHIKRLSSSVVALAAWVFVIPAAVSQNQYDEFNSNSYPLNNYPLSTSNGAYQAFIQSLPDDMSGLTAQLDTLLRQRLDEWHYPDLAELGEWILKCNAVAGKLISLASQSNNYPTMCNCAHAWDEARVTVIRMIPHNNAEEEEPIASEHKAAALAAILKAESICGMAHESVMPPLAPKRNSLSMPNVAPPRVASINSPVDHSNPFASGPRTQLSDQKLYNKSPYLWSHNIFGNETGIQWYKNAEGNLTSVPYFGDQNSPHNVNISPENIPSWGTLITDIHSHMWSDSPLYTYNSTTYQIASGFGGLGIWEGGKGQGLQPQESPFDFSHDDRNQANQAGISTYMIDPLGKQHIFTPFRQVGGITN